MLEEYHLTLESIMFTDLLELNNLAFRLFYLKSILVLLLGVVGPAPALQQLLDRVQRCLKL